MAEDFGTPTVNRREISPSALGDLNFDLEELDDKEFNLPAIDTPPTLESILNEVPWWVEARQNEVVFRHMDSSRLCPGKGLVLPNLNFDDTATCVRFLLLSLPNNDMSKISPLAIHNALIRIGGEPKSVK
ncbi:vacuolar protein sorting-associated protein 8-like protein [Trichonephila clavipes]|nr:vacuolar protein sorting-associated protein 8-like protein [Trichonephila clavipes]